MIFNSTTFLVFFISFYLLYWWTNNRFGRKARNVLILLASYLFYGWWDWRFLLLVLVSSLSDYAIGLFLEKKEDKGRKSLLWLSLFVNLGILGIFKYFNFFTGAFLNLADSLGFQPSPVSLRIILPVGISFYTFQTLSYTIDVYHKKIRAVRDPIAFFAFVSFFPQLVAGPIERASHLLPQFQQGKTFDYARNVQGLRLLLWGFFKKIVIADNFGVLADQVFADSGEATGSLVLFGAFCFALQIYADFSGYSDIAIGISRMLGFDLMKNFMTPYFSGSFQEFWRRWHISLSTWFRDYVYIPLGGSRNGRTSVNLFITFVLSGLWHGANATFLIWGALHGLLLIAERRLRFRRLKALYPPLVIFAVVLLWIPFRAENLTDLLAYTQSLFDLRYYSLKSIASVLSTYPIHRFVTLMMALVFFLSLEFFIKKSDFSEWIEQKSRISRLGLYYVLLGLILVIGNFSVKPSFIYFQF